MDSKQTSSFLSDSENQTNTTASIVLSLFPQKAACSLTETNIKIFSPVPHDPIAKASDKLIRLETNFHVSPTSLSPTLKIVHHAIVLDVSTSMRRERIEMAKSSIKSLINCIRESDVNALISLITFSSKVERIFTFKPITELTEKKIEKFLDQLVLSWGTRIDQGVLEILALDSDKAADVQDGLIFLITDGINDWRAKSAQEVMQTFLNKREILPRIIALGIGDRYDSSYVVQLLNKSPWFHIKNLDTASLVNEKDKIVHQLNGEWISVDLIIKSLNQHVSIPIASVDITDKFSITLTLDDLMAGGFLDQAAVDAVFNAREINVGIQENNSKLLALDQQIGFFDELLIPYFESAVTSFEKQSIIESLSLSHKNKALALFRIIPWTTERGFEKIRARLWNVSREHGITIQNAELGCESNDDPIYNRLRLRLKKMIEGKNLSKEIGAKLISDSSASASHTVFRGNRNTGQQEKQLIDPFSLHDFAEIDAEANTIQKPYLFLVIDNTTGRIQLSPCRYEQATIRAIRANAEKNYAHTKSLLPPGPYEQGFNQKGSIVIFKNDKILTDFLKTETDAIQLLKDINPVNQTADCRHIFVCSTSRQGFSEEAFLRAKQFMQNLIQNNSGRDSFSLISYNAGSTIVFEKKSVANQEDRELMLKDIENLSLGILEEDNGPSPSLGLTRAISLWADEINPAGDEANYYPSSTKIYLFIPETGDYDDYAALKNKYQGGDDNDPDCLNINTFNLLLHSGDDITLSIYRAREMLKYFSNTDISSKHVPNFTIFREHDSLPYFSRRFLSMYIGQFGEGVVEMQSLPVTECEATKGNRLNNPFFRSHVGALEVSEPSEVPSNVNYSP